MFKCMHNLGWVLYDYFCHYNKYLILEPLLVGSMIEPDISDNIIINELHLDSIYLQFSLTSAISWKIENVCFLFESVFKCLIFFSQVPARTFMVGIVTCMVNERKWNLMYRFPIYLCSSLESVCHCLMIPLSMSYFWTLNLPFFLPRLCY